MLTTVFTSCGSDDTIETPSNPPTPPTPPTPEVGAPVITVSQSEMNVFGGAKVEQADSSLLIGGEKAASWTSPRSKVTNVYLTFNGSPFYFGSLLSEK